MCFAELPCTMPTQKTFNWDVASTKCVGRKNHGRHLVWGGPMPNMDAYYGGPSNAKRCHEPKGLCFLAKWSSTTSR